MRVVFISVEGVFAAIADAAVCCRWVVVGTGGGFSDLELLSPNCPNPWSATLASGKEALRIHIATFSTPVMRAEILKSAAETKAPE